MRKLAAAFALFFTLLLPSFAAAQLPPGSTGLTETATQANINTNPANSNIGAFIGIYIIKPVIGLTGLIFLVLTIYAGVMWMTSAGDSKRIEHAKNVLVASITGVVIIATAYVVVNAVINAFDHRHYDYDRLISFVMFKAITVSAALALSFVVVAPEIQAIDLTTGLTDAAGTAGAGYNTSQNLEVVVGQIIKVVLGLLGVVFLIITVYAGITWMTAAGDEKKITSAKGMLTSAVIGLVIVLAAYSITFFVVDQLGKATSGPGTAPAAGT